MPAGLHTVAETPQFIRDAKAAGVPEEDLTDSDEVRGSGGMRKVRFPGRGKGKSGGYRVMTAYFGAGIPVYLIALLSKGDRANFSAAEVAAFKALTTEVTRYWQRRKR